jgi:hypothetical protein
MIRTRASGIIDFSILLEPILPTQSSNPTFIYLHEVDISSKDNVKV